MEHNFQRPLCQVTAAVLANLLAMGAAGALCAPQASDSSGRTCAHAHAVHAQAPRVARIAVRAKARIDRTGRPRVGIASFYANYFAGRKMANGTRMNPQAGNAASRTLPLGTVAKVTNLSTHRSAVVTIQDRGPYVQGRIVDLSPSTARRIGITKRMGIARVRVTPLAIPRPGPPVRLAAATPDSRASRREGLRLR